MHACACCRVMGITSESDVLAAGSRAVTFEMPDTHATPDPHDPSSAVSVGMACCFDLRFPVFLARYGQRVEAPAHCICAPSAFLDLTGKDHWDLLLRRTALDGQCYVIAPDIAFDSADATPLDGRAAVIDPFGTVLAQCNAQGDGVAIADLSVSRVAQVRANRPSLFGTSDHPAACRTLSILVCVDLCI